MRNKQLFNGLCIFALVSLPIFLFLLPVYAGTTPTPFYGDVELPGYLQAFVREGGEEGGAIIVFANILLRLVLVVAGFFALFKFIDAGFTFITSDGDSEKLSKGRDKLILTLVGLLVIVGAFVIAALVGIIFFKNPTAIIAPQPIGAPKHTPTPGAAITPLPEQQIT